MLPLDTYLVRHGESEGNKAKKRSQKGDNTPFDNTFRMRHTSSYRLTDRGCKQARLAGEFLRAELTRRSLACFDRCLVSEYARAMETAGLLDLPNAKWLGDTYLTERDWGNIDALPQDERREKFGDALERRESEPFFWRPPNGESFNDLCLRIDRVLDTLHRECSDKSVIAVCHGEVMRAFQARIERLPQARFRELVLSNDPAIRIENCDIHHYSRRHPETGMIDRHANWVRVIRPTREPVEISTWRQIERPTYTNSDLLEIADRNPRTVN